MRRIDTTDVNPRRAQGDWPAVVVAGAYQTGVVLMRNLARRGLKTYCFDHLAEQPGFSSVYGEAFLCPNPDERPEDWVEFMLGLSRRVGGRPVLISSADQFVEAIARHAEALRAAFTFHQPSASVQALLATKRRQYDFAEAHGLPVPRTRFVESAEEVAAFGESASFPCLLKPVHFREWERFPAGHPLRYEKLATAATAAQLLAQYRLATVASPAAVVQEIIAGPDTAKMVYLGCYGRDTRRLGHCLVRQLRTTPIGFGSASIVEPMTDPETDAVCDRFFQNIGYVGLCELELKRDSRDGRVKLIEANPRYSVTADVAPYAGVDLGWLHYLDLIGQPVAPVPPRARAFRHIVLTRDFSTVRDYRRAGLESWGSILRSYRPPVAFFDFDWRDRKVTAKTLSALARIVLRPAYRKLFPKRRPSGT